MISDNKRESLLWVLSAATFIIFFQVFMIAPLIPKLSVLFNTSKQVVGYVIPAYLIPYGIMTLFYGLLSDRIRPLYIAISSLTAFIFLTALTAAASTTGQLIACRLLTGIGASGVIPIALALTSRLYAYEDRGRPLGLLFGAMAGGSAFGSTLGVIIEPVIGWQALFISVAALGIFILLRLIYLTKVIDFDKLPPSRLTITNVFTGYIKLLYNQRGFRTYLYVFLNGIFHSGIFTWLGLYLHDRYSLGEVAIGITLIGYGAPGFLFGPVIGKYADRKGRNKLLPLGLALSALTSLLLILNTPLIVCAVIIAALSFGYDLTQPLLATIVTDIGKTMPGQAMGLNVFMLFMGFGVGSIIFGLLLVNGFDTAFLIFTIFQGSLATIAIVIFDGEKK
jgi:predicted MFS family arabinose efflux permease